MANKEFLKVYQISQETAYASNITPILKFSTLNKSVSFTPQFPVQGTNTGNTNPVYSIARLKRLKGKDAVDKYGQGAATNYNDILDAASDLDWETIGTQPVKKKQIALRFYKDSQFDVSNMGDANAKVLSDLVQHRMIAMEESATTKVWQASTTSKTKLTADGTAATAQKTANIIKNAVRQIQFIVDDFKAYDHNVVVVIHPLLADDLTLLNGLEWNKTGDMFGSNPNSFVYAGITFYVSDILNTIQGVDPTEVAGVIAMSTEAYANMGMNTGLTSFDETKIDERVVGQLYHNCDIVVDPTRIASFELTLPTGFTKTNKIDV